MEIKTVAQKMASLFVQSHSLQNGEKIFFTRWISNRGLIFKYIKNSKTIYQENKQPNFKIVYRFKQRILKLGSLNSWQTLKEMFDMVIREMQNKFLWDFTQTSQNGYDK